MSETKRWKCKHCGQPSTALSQGCPWSDNGTHMLIEDSVEEHMFNQDEIRKRHSQQPGDQQRRWAVSPTGEGKVCTELPEGWEWSQSSDQQRSEAVRNLQGKTLSEELDKIGIVELSNCKIICNPLPPAEPKDWYADISDTPGAPPYPCRMTPSDPLTAAQPIGEVFASMQTKFQQQPTGSAYSIEEHMFQQNEIQKRHATDQQRSEAEWKELDEQAMTSEQFDKLAPTLRAAHIEAERQQRSEAMSAACKHQSAAIAARDRMIAALRATNERLVAGQSTWYRTAEAQDKQIAAMQAKLQHVHDAAERSMPILHGCTLDRDWLIKFTTPTTEK